MRKSVTMGLVAGVLGMGMANAEIKVSDMLSLSGFLDMSATSTFPPEDAGDPTLNAAFDQFELDFMYTFSDKLTAQVDLNSLGGGAMVLEQAYLAYSAGAATLYAGKFLSSTGFEAAEPTGLYQYSYSVNCSNATGCLYGGYQNGVAVSYAVGEMFSLYGAVVGSVWDGTDTDLSEPGFEVQASVMPIEGVTAKVAYASTDVGAFNTSLVNAWGMYAAGALTVAAEVNMVTNWFDGTGTPIEDNSGLGYLAMVNFKLSEKLGLTARYSSLDLDVTGLENEVAVSPGYAISDSWFVLAEAKYLLEAETTALAVESILTF